MSSSERIAIGLASLLVAVGLYNGVNVLTDHLSAPDFSEHAKFHAALGGAYMVLLSVLGAVMTWSRGLRQLGKGLPLAGVLLALPLGFLVAVSIVPSGSPGNSYLILAVVGVALALIATALLAHARRDRGSR